MRYPWEYAVPVNHILSTCGAYLQYSWRYAVPVSYILNTCKPYLQYPWGYAVPVSHILTTCDDMQYLSYPQQLWVIPSVPVSHILSTCEDMQHPWVHLYERRMNDISFTGTAYPHGYWEYDSRLIHILTGTAYSLYRVLISPCLDNDMIEARITLSPCKQGHNNPLT